MRFKYAVKPLCLFVGAVRRENTTTFKVGLFMYDFKHHKGEMIWEKEEFAFKRDCILSLLPNKQGIPLIVTKAGFVNVLKKHNIEEYVEIDSVVIPPHVEGG